MGYRRQDQRVSRTSQYGTASVVDSYFLKIGRGLKLAWLTTAALVLLPVLPVHSESPVAITPSTVYSYESENFLVTVNDTRPLPISSVSVTTPFDLQIVGFDQNPNWSHLLTRNQSSYTT